MMDVLISRNFYRNKPFKIGDVIYCSSKTGSPVTSKRPGYVKVGIVIGQERNYNIPVKLLWS